MSSQTVAPELTPWGVEPVDVLMKRLKARAAGRKTMDVGRLADLNLRWEDQTPKHAKEGFYATIDGRDLRLSEGAKKTLNRMIKGPSDLRHWDQYPDRNAFVKAARHILDNRTNGGLQVRHDNMEVNCFLPDYHEVRDAHEMFSECLEMIQDNIGNIKGVKAVEEGYGDKCSYRIIMGENIIKAAQAEHGQYMMFLLSMSETGLYDTRTSLGLFRTICTNSAIHRQTLSRWNHRSGSESRFYDKTGVAIRETGYLQDQFSQVFSNLLNAKLVNEPVTLLNSMKAAKIISNEHWSAAKVYAEMQTEDGRPCETQYDLFNVLTRAAQDLVSLHQREEAEEAALRMFAAEEGMPVYLRNELSRRRIRNDQDQIAAWN